MRLQLGVLALMVAAAMPPAQAESLYERNYAALLATVPAGGLIEVQLAEDGELVTQLWTAEQYADFRAGYATIMGRDYATALQGVPGGLGDQEYFWDIWSDLWGTTRVNLLVRRGFPRTIVCEDKLPPCWLYGGSGATTRVLEHDNECVAFPTFTICSATYGWTYPQSGSTHGDAWLAGTGFFLAFPPPFGSLNIFDGVLLAEDL